MLEMYFQRCPEKIKKNFVFRSFGAGETILNMGDEISGVFLLSKGKAEILANNDDGTTVSWGYYSPWGLLGELELFAGSRTAENTIRTVAKSELYEISRRDFFDWLEHDPEFARSLFVVISQRFLKLSSFARIGIPGLLEQKIAYILLKNSEDHQLPLSKQALADRAGTSARSINRILKKLQEEGFVDAEGTLVRIKDEESLRQVYKNR